MKNFKFVSLLILSLFVFQTASAQSELDQGRANGAKAGAVKNQPVLKVNTNSADPSDRDVPQAVGEVKEVTDWVLPDDLDVLQDEMNASASPQEIVSRLNEMAEELAQLRRYNEQLRLENRTIKRSLGSCCSEVGSNLNAADAYLLQNAPNPAEESSEIRFFVPTEMRSAQIKISDVTGTVVKTFDVSEAGFGKIDVDRATFSNGTYIYSLEINGELIDTKVMIFTK
ncbi:MAG: T9SS type A sorting domain-containing protein [Bacteroidota bacterium]